MKISRLRTLWISALSIYYTAISLIKCILKNTFGHISRPWVDNIVTQWSNHLLNLAGITYTIYNPHKTMPTPGKATIIMVNHASVYDIPLSFKAFPNHSIRMLAKKELSKVPLMKAGMHAAGFLFIDRKNRHQAIKDLAEVKKLMESGVIMWLAPEGTRSKDGKIAPLKKGGFITAIKANAMIIPIGIRGAYDILPKDANALTINQHTELHIGESIDAGTYRLEDKDKLIQKISQALHTLTGQQQ